MIPERLVDYLYPFTFYAEISWENCVPYVAPFKLHPSHRNRYVLLSIGTRLFTDGLTD